MRILAVITGIMLMLTSIWAFANRGAMFISIAFVLGCVMVLAGCLSILVYFFAPGKRAFSGWFFAEGLVTLILGILVLANQLATDSIIIPFFGMWILFSGAVRVAASLNPGAPKGLSRLLTLALGLLDIAAGVYAFFNQIAAGLPPIILVGVFFLIQGGNAVVYAVFIPRKKKVKW